MAAEPFPHAVFVDDVDLDAQQLPQIHDEPAVVQQGAAGVEADDDIQVGIFRCVAAGNGPEDADVVRAVSAGDVQDGLAFAVNGLFGNLGSMIPDTAGNSDEPI